MDSGQLALLQWQPGMATAMLLMMIDLGKQ